MEEKTNYLSIEEFSKIEARIGLVILAEEVPGSEKLIKFTLDFGEESPRTILSGIKTWYSPESLVGKQMLFVTNLAPRKMMVVESQGMLMAIDGSDGEPVFLVPDNSFSKKVLAGAKVR